MQMRTFVEAKQIYDRMKQLETASHYLRGYFPSNPVELKAVYADYPISFILDKDTLLKIIHDGIEEAQENLRKLGVKIE